MSSRHASVAELGGALRRVDDVSEEHGRKYAVERRLLCAKLGEEASDLRDDRVSARIPVEVMTSLARVLDDPRAGNPARDEMPGLGQDLVEQVAVHEHERRHLNRRQHGGHVGLQVTAQLRCEPARGHGRARIAAEPFAFLAGRRVPPVRRAPCGPDELDLLLPEGERRHPRRVLGRQIRDLRVHEDQRGRSLRIHGGEEGGDDRRFVGRDDRGLLGADGAHHDLDVVREDVDVGDVAGCEPLRATPAATIGDDQTRMARQAAQEARQVPALPVHVDVGAVALEVEQVGRPLAYDLEGERHVAVPSVVRLRAVHARHRRMPLVHTGGRLPRLHRDDGRAGLALKSW